MNSNSFTVQETERAEERSTAEKVSARKRSYDMAFKLKVVACAEGESHRGAHCLAHKMIFPHFLYSDLKSS